MVTPGGSLPRLAGRRESRAVVRGASSPEETPLPRVELLLGCPRSPPRSSVVRTLPPAPPRPRAAGWESLWTCQWRSPPPPRAEVRAPARGPRGIAGGCGAGARLGDAAGGDPAPGAAAIW